MASRTPIRPRPAKPATATAPPDWPIQPGDDPLPLNWGELKSLYRNDPHRKTLRQVLTKKEKGS